MSFTQYACTGILLTGQNEKNAYPYIGSLGQVLFKPAMNWVAEACRSTGITKLMVLGNAEESVPELKDVSYGAAALAEQLSADSHVLLLRGDCPLLSPESIKASFQVHLRGGDDVTTISSEASEGNRMVGSWVCANFLILVLQDGIGSTLLPNTLPELAHSKGFRTGAYVCPDNSESFAADSYRALAAINRTARSRIIDIHLGQGVDIPFEDGIVIGPDVVIGCGTQIFPGTILSGATHIGQNCKIGPDSYIVDSTVENNSSIVASWLTDSFVGEGSSVGPFAQFRPGTRIGRGVKVGDFVELKNTTVGNGTSIAHLTYLGDSDIGKNCNFGCGVVTANYDGIQKYRTTVGDRAFVGCNTNLVPPVHVGEGAYTAAGTTVDQDVPAGALAIGRVRQEVKLGWADGKIAFKKGGV